jgi:hypothetical protein
MNDTRHKFVVELAAPATRVDRAPALTPAEVERLRREAETVRSRVLHRVESYRRIDPSMVINAIAGSIFPVLFITTVRKVRDLIANDPDVKSISRSRTIRYD